MGHDNVWYLAGQLLSGFIAIGDIRDICASIINLDGVNIIINAIALILKKLDEIRLIHNEKYRGITLTTEGEEIARVIKDRHDTLVRLLSIAGMPADIAPIRARASSSTPPEP